MQNTDITAGKPLSGNIVLEGSVIWWYRAVVKVVRQSLAVSIAVTAVCSNGNCIVRQKWIRINIRFFNNLVRWIRKSWGSWIKCKYAHFNGEFDFVHVYASCRRQHVERPSVLRHICTVTRVSRLSSSLVPTRTSWYMTNLLCFLLFFWHSLWILQQLTLFRPR